MTLDTVLSPNNNMTEVYREIFNLAGVERRLKELQKIEKKLLKEIASYEKKFLH